MSLHVSQSSAYLDSRSNVPRWPVIVGIIVGSVILLAVLACIFNCLCCGYQCCKCCCSCCCPSGRRRNKTPKHYDDTPFHKPPSPLPKPSYQPPPAPPSYRGAEQTARFDAPKSASKSPAVKVNEDTLPEMPTWAGAKDKHVENDNYHEDVEMEPLNPLDRKQGAGTPGTAYSEYPPNSSLAGGYRGFTPTDPYARRSPGPGVALDPAQDSYARRSPGAPSPGGIDPYGRRSPGPAAALAAAPDPFGRRSPGPAAGLAATQDPYGRRSPGIVPPAAAVDPYARRRSPGPGAAYSTPDPYAARSPGPSPIMSSPHNPYDQSYSGGYDDHYGAGAGYHATTTSPGGEHNPHMQYGGMPMAISTDEPTPGFQRQSSFGTTPYPVTPTYNPQPAPYRSYTPGATPSSPPPFSAPAPEYSSYNPHAASAAPAAAQPEYTRPPSLLQSGKKPQLNASSNF